MVIALEVFVFETPGEGWSFSLRSRVATILGEELPRSRVF